MRTPSLIGSPPFWKGHGLPIYLPQRVFENDQPREQNLQPFNLLLLSTQLIPSKSRYVRGNIITNVSLLRTLLKFCRGQGVGIDSCYEGSRALFFWLLIHRYQCSVAMNMILYDPPSESVIPRCPRASNTALIIVTSSTDSDMSTAWFRAKLMFCAVPCLVKFKLPHR